jgi:hypothetical protein
MIEAEYDYKDYAILIERGAAGYFPSLSIAAPDGECVDHDERFEQDASDQGILWFAYKIIDEDRKKNGISDN